MDLLKLVKRLKFFLSTVPVVASLACPVHAAPIDNVETGSNAALGGTLELKTGDEAAQAGANAATAAHGLTVLQPATITPATSAASAPVGAQAPLAKGDPAAKPADVDLRSTVREAAKPVLDEISRSAVGEAVRGMTSGDQVDADAAGNEAAGRRRNWDGQQTAAETDGSTGRRRTDVELAGDKLKATFLLQALAEEVAPWALAAAVLYALFSLGRVVWALRRRLKAEKRERRRMHEKRRRVAGTTSRGTPTQR